MTNTALQMDSIETIEAGEMYKWSAHLQPALEHPSNVAHFPSHE